MISVAPPFVRRDPLANDAGERGSFLYRAISLVLLLFAAGVLLAGVATGTAAVAGSAETLEGMDGEGTEAEPYVVTDVEELQAIDADPRAHYVLANDVDASETGAWNGYAGFEPIASADDASFDGSLDGRGYEIRGLTIDRPTEEAVGFVATANGTIENVQFVDATVIGDRSVGAVVGRTDEAAQLRRVSVSGAVTGDQETGGLVGLSAGHVTASSSTADLEAERESVLSRIGGLVGHATAGSIERSMAAGDVSGVRHVGGLVGQLDDGAHVSDSYAAGDVIGIDHDSSGPYFGWEDARNIGGLVGTSTGGVATSFATGEVTGTERYHGLFGAHTRVVDSYWDVDASGRDRGSHDDDSRMTGLTTGEMTGPEAADNMAVLDFETAFETTDDGYPILRSELAPAEFRVLELDGPTDVEAGSSVDVTATIENGGALEGTHDVTLRVNGSPEQTTTLTLGPDERETVAFEFAADVEGEYEYAVETDNEVVAGEMKSAVVTADGADSLGNGALAVGAVAAILVLSLVAVGARRR